MKNQKKEKKTKVVKVEDFYTEKFHDIGIYEDDFPHCASNGSRYMSMLIRDSWQKIKTGGHDVLDKIRNRQRIREELEKKEKALAKQKKLNAKKKAMMKKYRNKYLK